MQPTKLEIQLVHSVIGCPLDQRATVIGLGLRKMNSKKVIIDTPQARGMLAKVAHLVSIVAQPGHKTNKTKKKD